MGILAPTSGMRHTHRNLKFGYFSQHHVEQLDMNVNSVELLQQAYPGTVFCCYKLCFSHQNMCFQVNQLRNTDDSWEALVFQAIWPYKRLVRCLGGKNHEWLLPGCVWVVRIFWCWMNRRITWILKRLRR